MLVLAAIVLATAACGSRPEDPRCLARDVLRDAVSAVRRAETAESAGDAATAAREMDEVARLVAAGRARLRNSSVAETPMGRRILEAAEYLDFIVRDFRSSGLVDGPIAQFASRELNRAPAPGEQAPSC